MAISIMEDMIAIKSSNAKEDMKMFAKEVVEEHNGIYGGKWHIVSPEASI